MHDDHPIWHRSRGRSPAPLPGHAVLRSRDGAVEVLRRRERSRRDDRFAVVDLRRGLLTVAPQSISTAEGVDVQVTAAISVRVADPTLTLASSSDPHAEVYLAVQIALRDAVAALPLEQVLRRELAHEPVLEAARAAAAPVGLAVEDVVLKDVSAPRALAAAREEALVVDLEVAAALERARGEVKATRARAAAAQMLERSPVLARLRLLEALPPGTTLRVDGALGVPDLPVGGDLSPRSPAPDDEPPARP